MVVGKLTCGCVTEDNGNSSAVRKGFVEPGAHRSYCTEHQPKKEKKELDPRLLKPGKIDNEGLLIKLFHAGLTHDEIADIFGVSRVAVTNRVKKLALAKADISPAEFEKAMPLEFMKVIQFIMSTYTADDLKRASLQQRNVILGTLFDKWEKLTSKGVPDTLLIGIKHIHDLGPGMIDALATAKEERNAKRIENRRKEVNDDNSSGGTTVRY
jgi:hypothetical protein